MTIFQVNTTPLKSCITIGLSVLLLGLTCVPSLAQTTEKEEDTGPTPLSDFAPDEIESTRGNTYDQSLTINRISIEGNQLIPSEQIKSSMLARPGSLYSKNTLKTDLKRIYKLGYFTEKIKAVPIATNQGIHLRIEVQENAPVTGVNIEGNTIIEDSELQAIFADQTGLPQNIGQLNESIEKVEQMYAEEGYVLARVTGIADDPDGTINLEVSEGRINNIEFVGNRKTKDFVLKRAMAVKEGTIYNEKTLSEDLKRIFSTQSFSDVRRVISVSPDDPDKYNLTVEVDEKKTGAISLGGGIDTGTGAFGSVGYNDPNFLGRGQTFSSVFAVGTGVIARNQSTQASARTYQFDVGWTNPSLFESVNSLSTNVYGRDYGSFNVPLGVERRIGGEVAWARPLLSVRNTSFGLALRGERVSLREFASDSDLQDLNITDDERSDQLDGGTFISLSPTLAFDSRDNRIDPTKGFFSTVSMTGAYGLGASSYGTVNANVRKYMKIYKGITLALNAQAGSSLLGDIPTFNMFRLGGAYSVRGFQEGGLGIGNGFISGTAELRSKLPMIGKLKDIPVLNTMALATFVDAGQLFDESSINTSIGRAGAGASVGAGIRVTVPGLGPIRIDYAVPIMGGGGDFTRSFNFGVGQMF